VLNCVKSKIRGLDADNKGLAALHKSTKMRFTMLENELKQTQAYCEQLRAVIEERAPDALPQMQKTSTRFQTP